MKNTANNVIYTIMPSCPARCSSTIGCVSCNPSLRRIPSKHSRLQIKSQTKNN